MGNYVDEDCIKILEEYRKDFKQTEDEFFQSLGLFLNRKVTSYKYFSIDEVCKCCEIMNFQKEEMKKPKKEIKSKKYEQSNPYDYDGLGKISYD